VSKKEKKHDPHESTENPENTNKPTVTLPGTVQKIIKPIDPAIPEKAEIAIEGAEELYREIRIENTLKDEKGQEVQLKQGAEVDVTVEADPKDTTVKPKENQLKP
jgi:hypothetical protein